MEVEYLVVTLAGKVIIVKEFNETIQYEFNNLKGFRSRIIQRF